MKSRFLLALFCLMPQMAFANPQTIQRVEAYLSSLSTVVADFTQAAPDGTLTSGKFFMKRPKQMRWQYNPPTPILMVTRGDFLTYYDYELNQVSDIPLDSTMLGILSQQRVDFAANDLEVTGLQQEPGFIRITLMQRKNREEGALTLDFTDQPMKLRTMHILDSTGKTTSVALENVQLGVPLDDKVFAFKDPRTGGRKKKKK